MVILITGASHTGKTVLAQKLLEKYKIPYLSIDHLKMGLIRSGYTKLTPEEDHALTDYLWPIIREMIKTSIENGQNLIIEGCYIPFDWSKDFENQYLSHIKYYCLIMSEDYIVAAGLFCRKMDGRFCRKKPDTDVRRAGRIDVAGVFRRPLEWSALEQRRLLGGYAASIDNGAEPYCKSQGGAVRGR